MVSGIVFFNSNFLHLDFFHIYFNVLFLLLVGVGVERLTGIWNFIFIPNGQGRGKKVTLK
jgi:membrane associated rhomboid family serine protease